MIALGNMIKRLPYLLVNFQVVTYKNLLLAKYIAFQSCKGNRHLYD